MANKKKKSRALPLVLLASAPLIFGKFTKTEEPIPRIVQTFVNIYEGDKDDQFQLDLYRSVINKEPIPLNSIKQISNYFNCLENNARNFAFKQKNLYRIITEKDGEQTDESVGGIAGFHISMDKRFNRVLNRTISIENAFRDLELSHREIDPSHDYLHQKYLEIRGKVREFYE